jgi:histidine ammonia-lyase
MKMILLDGNQLTFEQIEQVVYQKKEVGISNEAWKGIDASRQIVEDSVSEGKVLYGITTGFGKFSDIVIPTEDVAKLQLHLIRSHASGVGQPFAEDVSRAMLLLRANALAKGCSGIRRETLQCLIACINNQVHPVIPQQGSLGASGDLAPLAHLALVLVGEGEAYLNGERLKGKIALQKAGIQPIQLEAKEGLALINGTQAMAAVGVIAYLEAERLAEWADSIAALTLEALHGVIDAFDEKIHHVRPYPEQELVAKNMRQLLEGSTSVSRQGEIRVQDAYSLRCIPQIHGASRQVLTYVKEKLLIEINAATDNPLIFAETGQVISGGNFHGQPIAFAMDFLGIGMAELANVSERRIERLVNPSLSGLPAFLSPQPGIQSGMMITQYAAASLVSENKVLAHPASVDSIPSSANQEDHVSMGTISARHGLQIIQNAWRVLAIEAMCAAQAIEFEDITKLAFRTERIYRWIREHVSSWTEDRSPSPDIERLAEEMKKEGFLGPM